MRVYIIVAGLALSVIGKVSATVVDKGIDLQRSCELLVQDRFAIRAKLGPPAHVRE